MSGPVQRGFPGRWTDRARCAVGGRRVLSILLGVGAAVAAERAHAAEPPQPAAPVGTPVAEPKATTPGAEGSRAVETPSAVASEGSPGAGPVAPPAAPPGAPVKPDPGPPPAEPAGVLAVGGRGLVPLPPPRPDVDLGRLKKGPWRGRWWFEASPDITVVLGGDRPARGSAVSLGVSARAGWRIHNAVGLASGLTLLVHDVVRSVGVDLNGDEVSTVRARRMVLFDVARLRLFAPVRGRFQPFVDVGAGVGLLASWPERMVAVGHASASVGFEGWVRPTFTIGLLATYRVLAIDDSAGHSLVSAVTFGWHR